MPNFKMVLAIETSCDDTSVSLVRHDGEVVGLLSAAQIKEHLPFGGVVPEIAGRVHTEALLPLIEKLMKETQCDWPSVDGVAVTSQPGLMGSLLVGVVTAKALALSLGVSLIGVNHLEGHLMAPFLKDDSYRPKSDFTYPFIGLAVSGGHTTLYEALEFGRYKIIGTTVDDAAGEAFDKFAKMLGLDFPGGVLVDKYAQDGDASAYTFPMALRENKNLNFSFSGVKTFARNLIHDIGSKARGERLADLCASFQLTIAKTLIEKLKWATEKTGIRRAIITGGVSANSELRKQSKVWSESTDIELMIPPLRYCTDNAAMIGFAGIQRLNLGEKDDQTLSPKPQVSLSGWLGDSES